MFLEKKRHLEKEIEYVELELENNKPALVFSDFQKQNSTKNPFSYQSS